MGFLLVHFQHKLDSVVGGGARGQPKKNMASLNKIKQDLFKSNLENEAADFPRFIVIE